MPNTRFRAGGKTYKHNIPGEKKFNGVVYYLSTNGNKRYCETIAKKLRAKGELARVVKISKGYEDANKKLYGVYMRLRKWDKSDA
jgi:hypothetical protein